MKRPGRWPLVLIAAPAAVAIWSGWVGLGELCGFGPVNLLPGIVSFRLNTAITLPVGVEAYAAYALSVWLWPGAPDGAKRFAGWSALGALGYGMLGQVAYHLLASHGYTSAPAVVVVLVSCMPVAVLGLAAALTHLLRPAVDADEADEDVAGEPPPPNGVSPGSPATPDMVPSSNFEAAKARMRLADLHGFKYSNEQAAGEWRLKRAEVTKARKEIKEEGQADGNRGQDDAEEVRERPAPSAADGQEDRGREEAGREGQEGQVTSSPAGVIPSSNGQVKHG